LLKQTKRYDEVIRLGNGSQFGELALIEDKPRAATVITTKDTHFLTIQKEDFAALLRKAEKRHEE
jgi:CRP-like cAMP-binding protein